MTQLHFCGLIWQAAEFAAQHFESTLLRHWADAGSAAQALKAAFLDVDAAFRQCHAATGEQQQQLVSRRSVCDAQSVQTLSSTRNRGSSALGTQA